MIDLSKFQRAAPNSFGGLTGCLPNETGPGLATLTSAAALTADALTRQARGSNALAGWSAKALEAGLRALAHANHLGALVRRATLLKAPTIAAKADDTAGVVADLSTGRVALAATHDRLVIGHGGEVLTIALDARRGDDLALADALQAAADALRSGFDRALKLDPEAAVALQQADDDLRREVRGKAIGDDLDRYDEVAEAIVAKHSR